MKSLKGIGIVLLNNFAGPGMGGGEVHLLNVASACRDAGMDVHVICQPGGELESAARALGVTVAPYRLGRRNMLRTVSRIRRTAGPSRPRARPSRLPSSRCRSSRTTTASTTRNSRCWRRRTCRRRGSRRSHPALRRSWRWSAREGRSAGGSRSASIRSASGRAREGPSDYVSAWRPPHGGTPKCLVV